MRPIQSPIIEIWSDSYNEGEWFLQNLAENYYKGRYVVSYEHNFQPRFTFGLEGGKSFTAEVLGGYATWTSKPDAIDRVLAYGKPDVIVYDPRDAKIILSVEETAAVPTGNQSLQRLERVWFAARSRIPFIYLLGEYGIHINGGVRRSSIWPVYLGLKLSSQYKVPSLTLFYGSSTHPGSYSVGSGVSILTQISHTFIMEWLGHNMEAEKKKLLKKVFRDMCSFVRSQGVQMLDYVAGMDVMDESFIDFLVERATT
jgi:hypothetical protein